MQWIEEVDRELSIQRESETRIYYEADLGEPLDTASLQDVAERRRDLLGNPEVMVEADALLGNTRDPVVRRKAELLRFKVIMMRIEDSPQMLAVRHELEQAQQDFKDEMKNPDGIRAYLKATDGASRARIAIANELARREGFRDYPEAKLTSQELSMHGLVKTLARVRETYEQDCRRLLSAWDVGALSQLELHRAVVQRLGYPGDAFPPGGLGDAARETLAVFGVDIEVLPITLEISELPYPGAVHALEIGRDIRVVMDRRKGGFDYYVTFFHELGHALYYAYVPSSVLLLDNRIAREGLADLWAALIETQPWLRRFGGLDDSEIDDLLKRRRQFHAYMAMALMREALFELALYENPKADFLEAWSTVTSECFGVENCSDVHSEFVFLYPLDIKDYIYAHLIRGAIVDDLAHRFGDDLLNRDVFEFIANHYCKPGNLHPWHSRLPGFDRTGAFAAAVQNS